MNRFEVEAFWFTVFSGNLKKVKRLAKDRAL